MKIKSIELTDPKAGWQLSRAEFHPDISLLVGLSGAGKTRILSAINRLKEIANGQVSSNFYGMNWLIEFEHNHIQFKWSGEYESIDNLEGNYDAQSLPFINDEIPKPNLISETLEVDNKVLVSRNNGEINLRKKLMPKLSKTQSVIYIFQNEDHISDAYLGMAFILSVDFSETPRRRRYYHFGHNFKILQKKFKTIDEIRNQDLPTHLKLALVHQNCPEIFDEISGQYKDAFPYVEQLDFQLVDGPYGPIPEIVMKEKGVDKPIPEDGISSGMHETLMHLSRMALWPDGMVVLIDEFENSLGVNCIDFVTDDLKYHSQRMQFLLTSHHPYIINNISVDKWKIVNRSGHIVSVHNADKLINSTSHHDAFLQLMNSSEYAEGIHF